MKRIIHSASSQPETAVAAADFEALRDTFYRRLRGDGMTLAALAAALGASDGDAAATFSEIHAFAHKLHGSAAIFEDRDVASTSSSLEQCASAAMSSPSSSARAAVSAAMEILMDTLTIISGADAAEAKGKHEVVLPRRSAGGRRFR